MENPKHCLSTAQQPPSRQPPSSRPEPHHSRGPPSHGRNRLARAGGRCWRMRSATLLVAARRAPQASRRGLGRGWGASCCCRHVPPRCSAGRGLRLGKGAVAGCGLRLAAGRTVVQCGAEGRGQGLGAALTGQSGGAWPWGWGAQCEGCASGCRPVLGSALTALSLRLEAFARVFRVVWLPVSTQAGAVRFIRAAVRFIKMHS